MTWQYSAMILTRASQFTSHWINFGVVECTLEPAARGTLKERRDELEQRRGMHTAMVAQVSQLTSTSITVDEIW